METPDETLPTAAALGDSFALNGWWFEVIDLDGRRIDKLLMARV